MPLPRPASIRTLALGLLLAGTFVLTSRGDDPPQPPVEPKTHTYKDLIPNIKPTPPVGIPDDPPPHEGAMIDYPLTIEPPDVITVEVFEALPSRPITGERLVRSDGTISLGFYGDVHVRGLSPAQAKVKIIHQLRHFLDDNILGLVTFREEGDKPKPLPKPGTRVERVAPQVFPQELQGEGPPNPARSPFDVPPAPNPISRRRSRLDHPRRTTAPARVRPARLRRDDSLPALQEVMQPDSTPPGFMEYIDPVESHRVFVDFLSYNTMVYFVQGDVGSPGRLPFTGRDTVLDAINYAGGLIPTAEPADIHLYRPARGEKPAKDYLIDLAAIMKGDARANLQIFPNDRLVVGRNAVVKKNIEMDRAAAPINSVLNALLSYSFTSRTLGFAAGDTNGATQATRDQVIRKWFDVLTNLPGGKAEGLDPTKLFDALPMKVEPKTDDRPATPPK